MVFVSGDKEALRAYHLREMALSDWTSGINYAREEGIKEVARKIKSRGRSFEEIAEDTGLSLEEFAKL